MPGVRVYGVSVLVLVFELRGVSANVLRTTRAQLDLMMYGDRELDMNHVLSSGLRCTTVSPASRWLLGLAAAASLLCSSLLSEATPATEGQ